MTVWYSLINCLIQPSWIQRVLEGGVATLELHLFFKLRPCSTGSLDEQRTFLA